MKILFLAHVSSLASVDLSHSVRDVCVVALALRHIKESRELSAENRVPIGAQRSRHVACTVTGPRFSKNQRPGVTEGLLRLTISGYLKGYQAQVCKVCHFKLLTSPPDLRTRAKREKKDNTTGPVKAMK